MNKSLINAKLANRFCVTPIIVKSGEGACLTTTNNETYIDFVLGNLTQIMGHRKVTPTDKISHLMNKMLNVGDNAHDMMGSVATDILEIAKKDKVRFTNSGSEAAHLAIRLARATNGRSKILKFVGHYHGWFNEEIGTFLNVSASEGIPKGCLTDVINIEWNDKKAVTEAFEKHSNEIAAVICEPCLAHSGTIPSFDYFLQFLRKISKSYGSYLILMSVLQVFVLH